MDPILVEFAKYGLAALLAGLVMYYLARAVRFLFGKYDEQTKLRIDDGRETVKVLSGVAVSIEANTAAIEALGEIIKAQNRKADS